MANGMDASLVDFFAGHETDVLRAPPEFTAWREETAPYHSLFERTLLAAADVRTTIAGEAGPTHVVNMASLDYLGICRHPEMIRAQHAALDEWGSGACGVPLLSGTTKLHRELEQTMCALTGRTGTIVFSSGFAGALGVCSALLRRGDVAVLDELAHMSWIDGVRMSGASLLTFKHNDPRDLDRVLDEHKGSRRVVIVDGLYSMDGDLAALPALAPVARAHDTGILVDEAHAIFALGQTGGGATEHWGAVKDVRVLFGTFSKALSVLGGFASADSELVNYMRYYGHPYVFSAALPPATVAGIIAAARLMRGAHDLRQKLADNASYFRKGLSTLGIDTGASETHVVPVILGDDRRLLYEGARELGRRGLYVAPVDFPAVPQDRVRLRCAVSAGHAREDLDQALNLLEEVIAPRLPRREAAHVG